MGTSSKRGVQPNFLNGYGQGYSTVAEYHAINNGAVGQGYTYGEPSRDQADVNSELYTKNGDGSHSDVGSCDSSFSPDGQQAFCQTGEAYGDPAYFETKSRHQVDDINGCGCVLATDFSDTGDVLISF